LVIIVDKIISLKRSKSKKMLSKQKTKIFFYLFLLTKTASVFSVEKQTEISF